MRVFRYIAGRPVEVQDAVSEPEEIAWHAKHAGLLILTDTFYAGWSAYVDGNPAALYQAYGLVRAIYLSQGEHMVEFVYFPSSFKIGLMISIVSFMEGSLIEKRQFTCRVNLDSWTGPRLASMLRK